MTMQIGERLDVRTAVYPADISTAQSSGWFSMAEAGRALVHGFATNNPAGESFTLTVREGQGSGGSNPEVLKTVDSEDAGSGGENIEAQLEVLASELNTAGGYTHIQVQIIRSTSTGSNVGGAVIALGDRRYRP